MPQRLPIPGDDAGQWGTILNEYLLQSLKPDGTLKDNIVTNANVVAIDQSKVTGLQASLDAKVTTSGTVASIWQGTQAQYDALPSRDATTLYVIAVEE